MTVKATVFAGFIALVASASFCKARAPSVASGGTSSAPVFDINKDGITDLLLIANAPGVDRRQLLAGTSAGTGFSTVCAGTADNVCQIDSESYMRNPDTRMISGDFDGDQRSDVLVISADPGFHRRMLLHSTGTGFSVTCLDDSDDGHVCGIEPGAYVTDALTRILPGDYNNDGKTDLLIISGRADLPRRRLLLSNGSTFSVACSGDADNSCGFDTEKYMFDRRTRLLTGDFNGDGRTDVLIVSGDPDFPRRSVLLSTGSGFSDGCTSNEDGGCGIDTEPYMFSVDTRIIPGDFNGDERTDILVISGDPSFPRRSVLIASGNSFVDGCVSNNDGGCGFDTEPYMFHPNTRLIAGNFAGDPKTDILVVSGDPSFPRRQLLVANGSGFMEYCVGQQDGACGLDTEPYMFSPVTRELVGKFNADGFDDLLVLSGDPTFPRRYLLLSNGSGFVDGCVSSTQPPQQDCGIHADFVQQPLSSRELPSFRHNYPARLLASTFAVTDLSARLSWAFGRGAERIDLDGASGKVYESGPITLGSFQSMQWSAGVSLRAVQGAFPSEATPFVLIQDATGAALHGAAGAVLTMRKDDYHDGEHRHGVSILTGHDVTVDNLQIRDLGGDGVYINGSGDQSQPSTNIRLDNLLCENNSRNGLSVINVNGLTVTNSAFKNTRRLDPAVAANGPQAGIDFEPNFKAQQLRNIVVSDVMVSDNANYDVLFALGVPDTTDAIPYSYPVEIDLIRVSLSGTPPAKAAVKFNYQAMSTLPANSRIRLDDLAIHLTSTNASLDQMIDGDDLGVQMPDPNSKRTCGFGVRLASDTPFVCKIVSGTFALPTREYHSWLDNMDIH